MRLEKLLVLKLSSMTEGMAWMCRGRDELRGNYFQSCNGVKDCSTGLLQDNRGGQSSTLVILQ